MVLNDQDIGSFREANGGAVFSFHGIER